MFKQCKHVFSVVNLWGSFRVFEYFPMGNYQVKKPLWFDNYSMGQYPSLDYNPMGLFTRHYGIMPALQYSGKCLLFKNSYRVEKICGL